MIRFQADSYEISFNGYLDRKKRMEEQCKVRTSIESMVKEQMRTYKQSGVQMDVNAFYGYYFNYELNTHTWRMVVNKQILMNYERLLFEMQVNEIKKREKKLKLEIETIQN